LTVADDDPPSILKKNSAAASIYIISLEKEQEKNSNFKKHFICWHCIIKHLID